MKYTFSGGGGWRQWRQLAAATTLLGSGLLAATGAQAISPSSPPAGQSIANQAAVSYKDNNGSIQTTTSNTVVTTISQVGSYAVTPGTTSGTALTVTTGNGKSAGAGAIVYSPYTITNNGNGADDFKFSVTGSIAASGFNKIQLFEDDGTAQPKGSALCEITTTTDTCSTPTPTTTKSVGSGSSYKFVVAYTMGASFTSSNTTAKVTVSPAKASTIGYAQYDASTNANATEARTDTIAVATDAAFSVGKAIKAPTAAAPSNLSTLIGSSTWPVNTSGLASTGTVSQYTTFTLAYSNTGVTTRNLYIQDALPNGFAYVSGTAVSSSCLASGTALAQGTNTCTAGGAIDFDATTIAGGTIKAVIPNVAAGASGTLSFVVKIDTGASVGVGSTTNTAKFTPDGARDSGSGNATTISQVNNTGSLTDTNSAAYTVLASRSVVMGPAGATATSAKDGTAGTPNSSADTAAIASMAAGSTKMVEVDVINTGTADDTFNLSIADKGNFPADAVFTWFSTDGLTPLFDTDGNGTVDTGIIAAGASKKLYVQVFLPSTTPLGASANLKATVQAQSKNDTTQKDATYVTVTSVDGGLVDLVNTGVYNSATNVVGDWGPGPGTKATYTANVLAGVVAEIPLYIVNNDSTSTTYSLAAGSSSTMSALPSGWSVKFSSTACTSATAVTGANLTVAQNARSNVIYACVTTPANETSRTQAIYIQVTSSTDSAIKDTLYDAVTVTSQTGYAMKLEATGSGSVVKGNNTVYALTLSNTGANTCGATTNSGYLSVDVALDSASVASGWTSTVYLDVNNNGVLEATDTLISNGKLSTTGLPAGNDIKFLARLYAPSGANAGDTAVLSVTVKDVDGTAALRSPPTGCGQQAVSNSITVTSGNFQVVKSHATQAYSSSAGACPAMTGSYIQTAQTAKPGDCIYYQVVATNTGTTSQKNVSISDAAPGYTTLQTSPAVAATCSSSTLAAGSTAVAVGGTAPIVTCGSATNELPVGGSLTMTYVVRIND
jgi:uncharacterized repeat protein (TIGR01451 family)